MIRGLARLRSGGLSTRSRTFAVYALLLAANFGAWAWAFSAFHAYPILLGTAALAYSFGLRHAFDADHIAAIDNVTRKLMQQGQRPVGVGLYFSLGHSTIVVLASLALAGGQAGRYMAGYYLVQKSVSDGGDGLTRSLCGLTEADEFLVITGQDWNSMTPYYARRRALMIRPDVEENLAQLDAAFAALAGEKIGALVLGPATSLGRGDLIRRAEALGIDRHPVYRWRDFTVYLRSDRREETVRRIRGAGYDEVVLIPVVKPPSDRLADDWFEVAGLTPVQREYFAPGTGDIGSRSGQARGC